MQILTKCLSNLRFPENGVSVGGQESDLNIVRGILGAVLEYFPEMRQTVKKGKRSVSAFDILKGSPLGALLFSHGTDDGGVGIEGFFRMAGLHGAVAVAELFKTAVRLLEHPGTDITQPFETVIVGWWCGVHGADSMSSRGVMICGVWRFSELLMS